LDWLLRQVGAPSEVCDALRLIKGYVDQREDAAYSVLDAVKGPGPKTELDGQTREGLRQAVLRIRSMAPKAAYRDIELVLAAAFEVDASLIDAKALSERRVKSEKVKQREKAARLQAKPRP
jgi:hypothetical protein